MPLRHMQQDVKMVIHDGISEYLNFHTCFGGSHDLLESRLFTVIEYPPSINDPRDNVIVRRATLDDSSPAHTTP